MKRDCTPTILYPTLKHMTIYTAEFFAVGTGQEDCTYKGTLTDQNTNDSYTGEMVWPPLKSGYWVIYFAITKSTSKGPFTLEISNPLSGKKQTIHGISYNPKGKKRIQITIPDTQSCCDNFNAQGTIGAGYHIDGATMTSTTIQNPPTHNGTYAQKGTSWTAIWGTLPDDSYNLHVHGTDNTSADAGPLALSSLNC